MSMDAVFKALAGATRRRLLDSLRARNGQTLGELCACGEMTRQAVTKHLAILEAANLVAARSADAKSCTSSIPFPSTRSARGGSADTDARAWPRWRI
jgi:DNA-binding transcriptional ArsR family regulator